MTNDWYNQPILKTAGRHSWGLINGGVLVAVYRTRRECIEYAQDLTGYPWSECKKFYRASKITVTDGWEDKDNE